MDTAELQSLAGCTGLMSLAAQPPAWQEAAARWWASGPTVAAVLDALSPLASVTCADSYRSMPLVSMQRQGLDSATDALTGLSAGSAAMALPMVGAGVDDFAGSISTLGAVLVGSSASGVVEASGDRDWFRVSLTAGLSYRFNLNGNTLSDTTLFLRDSVGTQLAFNDDSNGGSNSEILFTATTTGTYYLDAGAYTTLTGSYSLLASQTDDFVATTSTTGSVAVGGSVTGVVNSSGDRDWFRVSLTAGLSYRFNLNGNTLSDTTLFLRDSVGTQLAFNDDSNGGNNSEILFTATTTGTYYLDAGGYTTLTGSYSLLASQTDDYAATTSTTGSVAVGGSVTGVVNSSGDRDWFRVSLSAGRNYRFNLNGNTLSDTTLALRNSAGTQLAFNDDSNGGKNSEILFSATTTGTYYLDAGGYSTQTGSYTLLATDTTAPSDDYAALISTTGAVAVGGSVTGVVNSSGDRDWFRVALTAGRSYRLSVNGTTLNDPDLYLRDSLGNQIAYSDDSNGLNPEISFTPGASANYYLDVGGYSTLTGSYGVVVTDTTPTDDYAATTSTTGLVAIGGSSTGVVNTDADRDWFRISLTQGRSYRFNLNGTTLGDPTLYLRDSLGAQLAYSDDANGYNSEITFVATATGSFYLDAGGYGSGTGSYSIAATDTTPVDDYAATTSTLGVLTIGGTSTGVVNTSGDRDWFRVSLSAGVTYRLTLNGTTLSDPNLYLRDSLGNQLSFNDDFNGLNSQITFTAANSGTYFLDAGGYGANAGGYSISAVATAAPATADDYLANTSTTGSVSVGATRTGVIETGSDSDWFRLSLSAGSTYRFNLTGSTLTDTLLYLRDSAGNILESNDDIATNNLNSQITFSALASGTYYLDARAYGSLTGSYTVGATLVSILVPTIDDFAGSSATTGIVNVGGSASGVINSNADRDWFAVSLQAGRTYRFSVTGSTLYDPELYLRSSAGAQLSYADDSNGSLNPLLDFACITTGSYYLDVGSSNNVGVGTYTVQAIDQQPSDDYAANSSTTGTVAIGGSTTGVVNVGGDRDWFRVSLTAGTTYRFDLTGSTLSDPTLYLRDSLGNLLVSSDNYNGLNPQITYTPTASGGYFLDAGSYAPSGVGAYTLLAAAVGQQTDDYTADTTSSGRLSVGRSVGGTIEFSGDRDWYLIELTAGRSYQFNLDAVSLSDPTLRLYDGTGGTLLASNDNFGAGRNSQISFSAVTSGNYYLDAGAVGSLLGTYSLSATDVSIAADRIAGLQDAAIRQSVNTSLSDNIFTKGELASILRNAAVSGVTSIELSDFRIIGNNLSSYLSATTRGYLQYIYNAVVNGNTANQWWTAGASNRVALGNLTAGSSELQLNRLVDKWFGGLDLPANFVGGDSAAGLSSLTFSYAAMTGSLFVNDVNYDDVNQGQAGTCYLLASLAALATNNKQAIRDMFRDNGDGTFGVRFFSNTGNEIWVTVNRSVPVVSGAMALVSNSSRSLAGEMWVALAEKAYAQANETGAFARPDPSNGYRAIEGGLFEPLAQITGLSITAYSSYYDDPSVVSALNDPVRWNTFRAAAIAAFNSGRSLYVDSEFSTRDSSGKLNFVAGHAQAIVGYNAVTGNFVVANPWGVPATNYAPTYEVSWRQILDVRGIVAWV